MSPTAALARHSRRRGACPTPGLFRTPSPSERTAPPSAVTGGCGCELEAGRDLCRGLKGNAATMPRTSARPGRQHACSCGPHGEAPREEGKHLHCRGSSPVQETSTRTRVHRVRRACPGEAAPRLFTEMARAPLTLASRMGKRRAHFEEPEKCTPQRELHMQRSGGHTRGGIFRKVQVGVPGEGEAEEGVGMRRR